MKRRGFLHQMSLGTGALMLLPSIGLLQSCEYKPVIRTTLSEADIPFLDEIGETIIPSTESSPGAKATNIGAYMLLMYQDCMPTEEQVIFLDGINELDKRAALQFSDSFVKAKAPEKLKLFETLQMEAESYYLSMEGTKIIPAHFFQLFKNLTLSGYFSSEIGMTQAREYLPVPGKFTACIPYNSRTDKTWAI